ncbi:hypothetical protein BIW11_01678 [Tropilaelaps mercedesae]|uniref:Uncharacterized protein n=1 Tax=Tropilaelaps mercedesae TaxID=418985 RepID=A0A1V9XAL5_9ACAR|nr:hypothetical protein BIW11_01678 [Tropilaelaps mercedesae]
MLRKEPARTTVDIFDSASDPEVHDAEATATQKDINCSQQEGGSKPSVDDNSHLGPQQKPVSSRKSKLQDILRVFKWPQKRSTTRPRDTSSLSESEVKIYENALDTRKRKIDQLEVEKASLERFLFGERVRQLELKQERHELNEKVRNSELKIARLEEQLRAAESNNTKLQSQLDRTKFESDSVQQQILEVDTTPHDLLQEISEKSKTIQMLEANLRWMRATKEELLKQAEMTNTTSRRT